MITIKNNNNDGDDDTRRTWITRIAVNHQNQAATPVPLLTQRMVNLHRQHITWWNFWEGWRQRRWRLCAAGLSGGGGGGCAGLERNGHRAPAKQQAPPPLLTQYVLHLQRIRNWWLLGGWAAAARRWQRRVADDNWAWGSGAVGSEENGRRAPTKHQARRLY